MAHSSKTELSHRGLIGSKKEAERVKSLFFCLQESRSRAQSWKEGSDLPAGGCLLLRDGPGGISATATAPLGCSLACGKKQLAVLQVSR